MTPSAMLANVIAWQGGCPVMAEVGLTHYLVVGAILFVLGVVCLVTRRNAVAILMGVELILNSANLNFVAFAHFQGGALDGQVAAIFGIVLAAAEAAVALAIVLALYRCWRSIDVESTRSLEG